MQHVSTSALQPAAQQHHASGNEQQSSDLLQQQAAPRSQPAEAAIHVASAALQQSGLPYPQCGDVYAEQQNLQPLHQDAGSQQQQEQQQQQLDDQGQLARQQHTIQQQQQHSGDSSADASHSALASVTTKDSQDEWLRQQRGEWGSGVEEGGRQPEAVFTSAATGAGLSELLRQIERKVSCRP